MVNVEAAAKAMRDFAKAMERISYEKSTVPLPEKYRGVKSKPYEGYSKEHLAKLMEKAICEGDDTKYRKIRDIWRKAKDEEEENMISTYDFASMKANIFIEYEGGCLKINDCHINSLTDNFQSITRFSARGSMCHSEINMGDLERTLVFTSGKIEKCDSLSDNSLNKFSTLELLNEIEKRTNIKDLLNS